VIFVPHQILFEW